MKSTNIFYWVATALFAAFMLFSAIPDVMLDPKAVVFMQALGYPNYFTVFIGVAKILGAIVILIPANFPKLKEWAYAGFFFDLLGATYSQIATGGFKPEVSFMLLPLIFLFVSYYLYHKRTSYKLSMA